MIVSAKPLPARFRIASHGKRLFALMVDGIFALLLVNTFHHLQSPEHWDLLPTAAGWLHLLPLYLAFLGLLLCKDCWKGYSPGKFIFGLAIRPLDALTQRPSVQQCLLRNLSLLLLPIEGILLLVDSHGRRLGDRWFRTVVIENPNAPRILVRLMVANMIFFAYFFGAFLISPVVLKKTDAYQTAIAYIQSDPEVAQKMGRIEAFEAPEVSITVQENTGSALVLVKAVGKHQSFPITVHLQLVTSPKRFWQAERLEFGAE